MPLNLLNLLQESSAIITLENSLQGAELIDLIQTYTQFLTGFSSSRVALALQQNTASAALLLATIETKNTDFILIPPFYPFNKINEWLAPYHVAHFVKTTAHDQLETTPLPISENVLLNNTESAICLLTSGTTGIPKISRHTWGSLTEHVKRDKKYTGGKWLLGYPLAHFAGLQVVTQCFANGGTLIIPSQFDAGTLSQLLLEYQPDYLNCTPTLLKQLLFSIKPDEFKKIPLKNITLGGEIVDQNSIDHIKKYLPSTHVSHIYASTELGAIFHVTDEKEGFPLHYIDNIHLKIDDSRLFAKKTKRSMKNYLAKEALSDEWIDTKDIVEINNDRVLFRGREDDIINVGGFKVSPIIVENTIKNITGVKDVVIVGEQNILTGNLIKAIIVMDDNQKKSEMIKKIIQYCREHLAYYMVPSLFDFVDEIPRSMMNKKLRKK